MKKVLFSLFTVMLILTSCGADPVKFNDSILKEQRSMFSALQEYNNKLGQATATGSFDNIKPLGDSLIVKLDKSIALIKGLDAPSGGEKFKEAAIEYFESAKKMTTIGDKALSLGEEASQESVNAFMQDVNNLANEVNEKENALLSAQKEFAKEKGMKLQ